MKYKILSVLVKQEYLIKVGEDGRTNINGWTIEQVVDDWFSNDRINISHATRDGRKIGNADEFVDFNLIEKE